MFAASSLSNILFVSFTGTGLLLQAVAKARVRVRVKNGKRVTPLLEPSGSAMILNRFLKLKVKG